MRDVLAHDSRRVRLLALLGIAAAIVLARAETSQAFSDEAFEVAALRNGASGACAAAGPCFFLSIELRGNGRVTSTADPAGTRIDCPTKCSTAPDWFIWGLDAENPNPYIELIQTGGVSWIAPSGQDTACHPRDPDDPPIPAGRCRIYANNVQANGGWCVVAHYAASPVFGGCEDPTQAPVGEPLAVQKWGSGQGTVTSFSTGGPGQKEINCGSVCSSVYMQGVEVTLQKFPATGSRFVGWTGTNLPAACTTPPTNLNNCVIQVSGPTVVARAKFDLIDPPAPAILNAVILSKPAKTTRKRTARFAWGAKRAGTFVNPFQSQCKLNRQVWKSCRPAKTYRNLRAGRSHTFRVRVKDAKRNEWDKTPAVWTWRIRR